VDCVSQEASNTEPAACAIALAPRPRGDVGDAPDVGFVINLHKAKLIRSLSMAALLQYNTSSSQQHGPEAALPCLLCFVQAAMQAQESMVTCWAVSEAIRTGRGSCRC
jgi:hypothetical protein